MKAIFKPITEQKLRKDYICVKCIKTELSIQDLFKKICEYENIRIHEFLIDVITITYNCDLNFFNRYYIIYSRINKEYSFYRRQGVTTESDIKIEKEANEIIEMLFYNKNL